MTGWHDSRVVGVSVRVHDMHGDDLGIAHVPTPIRTGDLILLEHGEYRVLDVIPLEDQQSPAVRPGTGARPGACTSSDTLSAESLDRVNVTRKGDFSPPRPMMWVWGEGSGLSSTAPCLLGSGARQVRDVNRCHRESAT
jgi:hypothetical protein